MSREVFEKVHYVMFIMFVARTRFPVKPSIVYVLQKLYGMNVRKFKYKNAILILDFLLACKEKNIIPKFSRFKVASR